MEKNQMNPVAKKLWNEMLLSGDIAQTTGALRDARGMCCLGVLCNAHAKAHPNLASRQDDPYSYLNTTGYLPKKVVEWAGLQAFAIKADSHEKEKYSPEHDDFTEYRIYYKSTKKGKVFLDKLNDEDGKSFKQIAGAIKRNF